MATIRKRNGSYQITVSCGYGIDGKQIRRTKTYTPDPSMTAKQIEKEVQRQAVLFQEQCDSGVIGADGKIKFYDYVPLYLSNAKHVLSPTVYADYTRALNNYMIPALGHLRLKDIKPLHVQRFVNMLQEKDISKSGKVKHLASATVRRYYTILQSVLHSAYKLGIIGVNPADSDKITLPKLSEQKTEIFTIDEVNKMLDSLENEPLQFKVLIHLALNTGCRRGELVGLKWNDINYSNNVLTVSRSNYKLKGIADVQSKETKTGQSRRIVLPDYCISLLKQLRAKQAQQRFALGDKWNGDNWIFTQADGKPMYPSTPTLQFSRFLKRVGMEHRKFHALRHTSATLLLSNGTNIKNVASRLGHAQLKTTNRYVHAIDEADRQAANTFEVLLNSNRKRA